MSAIAAFLKSALRSPLLPFWLVIALLPFGRSAELGTFLCLIGTVLLFARHPAALREHAGARLLLWLLAAYVGAALISAVDSLAPGKSWGTVAALLRYVPLGLYACFAIRREDRLGALYEAVAAVLARAGAAIALVSGIIVAGGLPASAEAPLTLTSGVTDRAGVLGSDAAQARPSAIVARCSLHILICQHWRPGWVQQQPAIAGICPGTSTRARACLGLRAWHARQQGGATSSLLPCMPCFQVIQQRASCRGNGNTSSKGP